MDLCRHCHRRAACRVRNLCSRCYETPAIRTLYPPPPASARPQSRGADGGDFCGGYGVPDTATAALPGTDEKVAALGERVRARVGLWRGDDARADGR
jgi:hypothetical protein